MKAKQIVNALLEEEPDDIDPKQYLMQVPSKEEEDANKGIRRIGSQLRQKIQFTDYELVRKLRREIIVRDKTDPNHYELWYLNNQHSGYTLQVAGQGYEFGRDLKSEQVQQMIGEIPPKAFHGGFGGSMFPITGGGQG